MPRPAAQATREIRHRVVQRCRHRIVAALVGRCPAIVAPRGVVGRQRADDEPRDETVAPFVTRSQARTEIVAGNRRDEMEKPRFEDRRRRAVSPGIVVPLAHERERLRVGLARRMRVRDEERHERLRMKRGRVRLHRGEIVRRERACPPDQIGDALSAIRAPASRFRAGTVSLAARGAGWP